MPAEAVEKMEVLRRLPARGKTLRCSLAESGALPKEGRSSAASYWAWGGCTRRRHKLCVTWVKEVGSAIEGNDKGVRVLQICQGVLEKIRVAPVARRGVRRGGRWGSGMELHRGSGWIAAAPEDAQGGEEKVGVWEASVWPGSGLRCSIAC